MYIYGLTITPTSKENIINTDQEVLIEMLKSIEKLGYGSIEWTTVGYEIKKQNNALHCHALYHCHKKPWFKKIVKKFKGYQVFIQILVTEYDETNFRNYCIKEANPCAWEDYPPGCTKMPGWALNEDDGPFPLQTHYIKQKHSFVSELP
jgi:hypothetical protein